MQAPRLIGLTGPIGSGKDTAADYLEQHYGFVKLSFAIPVKRLTATLLGLNMDEIMTREVKAKRVLNGTKTVGQVMQGIGEGLRQSISPDLWVDTLFANWDPTDDDKWVIADVRYPNEVTRIQQLGGVVIQITGDPKNIRANQVDQRDPTHASETALQGMQFYHQINNDGSMENLYRSIDTLMINRFGFKQPLLHRLFTE